MPSFDARRRELRAALAVVQSTLDIAESTRIATVLEDYLNHRDAVLTMMQVLIADEDPEPLADEYAGKLRDMTRTATDKLDNMLSGVSNPTAAAVRFREQVSFGEFIFWGHVAGVPLGQARDKMARDGQRVRELIAALDKKWQNLSEEDLRIEEAEQRAVNELKDLLETSLAAAMPYWLQAGVGATVLRSAWKSVFTSITEHVKEVLVAAGAPRNLVDALLKLASWANDVADIYEIAQRCGLQVDVAMTWLNRIRSMNVGGLVQYRVGTLVDSHTKTLMSALDFAGKGIKPLVEDHYERRMAAFKAQLDNEGVIIVAYGGIRQQVDQFLKECNLDGLRATHASVLSSMDALDALLGSDGSRTDWSDLKRSLKDAFATRRQVAEKAFEDFYRANDGRFIGGLSSDTERALIETDKWLYATEGLIAVGLDTRLREWRATATVVQAGPREAFNEIQDAFAGLPLDIRDNVKNGVNEYLNKQVALINTEADKAIAALEKCSLMVNAQKISSDMDRTRLQQALRATIR